MTLIKNSSLIKAEQTKWDLLKDVFADRARDEEYMNFRNPWFNMMYNYLIAVLVILLAVSLFWWGVDIYYKRQAEEQAAVALASYQAEEQAKAEAKAAELAAAQRSEEAMIDRWSQSGAKMLYGIRLFVDKYHYSEADYKTYLQCVWNRYIFGQKLTDVDVIIAQRDQFLGYYDTNPILDNLYRISKDFFTEKLHETTLACDPSYRWAELTGKGIYLVDEFGADGYVQRWSSK